jgi:murein endopeptidase
MHVRMICPFDDMRCIDQVEPAPGNGCDRWNIFDLIEEYLFAGPAC